MNIDLTIVFYIALGAAALFFIVMTAVDALRQERDDDSPRGREDRP